MQKDTLETLLLRHYGDTAQTPPGLEKQLLASVRQQAEESRALQQATARWQHKRMSRRHAVRLVAIGTAGLSVLSAGLEGLQMLETALIGQDITQKVFP